MKKFPKLAVVPLVALLAACAGGGTGGPSAEAVMSPTKGNSASGTVSFRQEGDNVVVVARISGLTPGAHGFHSHEKGDCSDSAAAAAAVTDTETG